MLLRLPSKAALYTHMKNCHSEHSLEMMEDCEEEEEEEFDEPLGRMEQG